MPLAPFFDKTALAAAAVLQGFDWQQFARTLDVHTVGVAFDDAAAQSTEGRVTLELAVNLLARLYPTIFLVARGDKATTCAVELEQLARAVNPNIAIVQGDIPARESGSLSDVDVESALALTPGALIVVGQTPLTELSRNTEITAIYVGSHGWEARLSTKAPVGSGPTTLPFGAAAAACLGAANLFRFVFRSQLPAADLDAALTFSTLSLVTRIGVEPNGSQVVDGLGSCDVATVDLGQVVLAGAGAVGQGTIWTLMRLPQMEGTLHVVDGECVDNSNPQRYILTASADVGAGKVSLVAAMASADKEPTKKTEFDLSEPGDIVRRLPREHARVEIVPHGVRWGAFLAALPQPWRLERVIVALDSARDRIAVQAALPQWIANAWTQPGDLGLSRHTRLGESYCLACLYLPTDGSAKSEDVLISDAVGLPGQHLRVRPILATNAPVDETLLAQMAAGLGVPLEPLMPFVGRPLRAFYSEAICGGVVLRLRAEPTAGGQDEAALSASGLPADRAAMVPMAFQSVLAGVLLAAAVVADAAGLETPAIRHKAVIDLLRPFPSRLLVPVAPHPSGKCLCQDADYLAVYSERWQLLPMSSEPIEEMKSQPMRNDRVLDVADTMLT